MELLEIADLRPSDMETDLYSDIDHVRERIRAESDVINQVEAKAHESEQRAKKAKRELTAYKVKAEQLRQRCTMLEKNLSCLFRTAWEHLHRKDKQILDLKQQIKEFRKVTGMVAPGVKSGDLNMEQWHKASETELRTLKVEQEHGANENGRKKNVTFTRTPDNHVTHSPVLHDREVKATDSPVAKQEPTAPKHSSAARAHPHEHRSDGKGGREQTNTSSSGQDLSLSRAAPSSPRRRYGAELQAQANIQQGPRRDREMQQRRGDREEDREGWHRDRGTQEYRSRGNRRDSWESRQAPNGSADLRASLGSARDRQRGSKSRQRNQVGRIRSRSP